MTSLLIKIYVPQAEAVTLEADADVDVCRTGTESSASKHYLHQRMRGSSQSSHITMDPVQGAPLGHPRFHDIKIAFRSKHLVNVLLAIHQNRISQRGKT